MTAKELIEILEKLDPNTEITVTNGMSHPFYDYGQKGMCKFDEQTNSIEIIQEC